KSGILAPLGGRMRFFKFRSAATLGSIAAAIALAFAPTLGGQTAGAAAQQSPPEAAPAEAPRPLTLEERADILFARREYPAVVALLTPALQDHGDDAGLYNRLGMAYQELSDLGHAEKYY